MCDIGRKIIGFISQLVLLPVYTITWVLGSPYLMTLLCIMSEVLVELVVSAVMAGVSLVVSAVILMEDDHRPLINEQSFALPKMIGPKKMVLLLVIVLTCVLFRICCVASTRCIYKLPFIVVFADACGSSDGNEKQKEKRKVKSTSTKSLEKVLQEAEKEREAADEKELFESKGDPYRESSNTNYPSREGSKADSPTKGTTPSKELESA